MTERYYFKSFNWIPFLFTYLVIYVVSFFALWGFFTFIHFGNFLLVFGRATVISMDDFLTWGCLITSVFLSLFLGTQFVDAKNFYEKIYVAKEIKKSVK